MNYRPKLMKGLSVEYLEIVMNGGLLTDSVIEDYLGKKKVVFRSCTDIVTKHTDFPISIGKL